MPTFTEPQLRRRAAKYGYRLNKIRESSRDYPQYGPYALLDAEINGLVAYGLSLDEVGEFLDS